MENYFALIVLSGSALNAALVIFATKEYVKYRREKNEFLFKQKIDVIKTKERKQLVNYISSELHDNISQMISLAIMKSASLQNNNEGINLINIQNILNKTLVDVRYLIKTIKLRESADFDLDYQIEELVNILNQSTPIKFIKKGNVPLLDSERKYLLLRIIQELLNNVLKYSKANKVKITFENSHTTSVLRIGHNGESFKPIDADYTKGYGLTNIVENTKLLNGVLDFESHNSNIMLEFPLLKENRNMET